MRISSMKSKINYYNIIAIFSIVTIFSYTLFTILPDIQNKVNDIKLPSLPKSQPCVIQSTVSGNIRGTISSGNCNELEKKGYSKEEQKIFGTWKIDTEMVRGSIKFNYDKTGTFSTQLYGNIFFNYEILNGKIYSNELRMIDPIGNGIPYNILNNGKTLNFAGISFDKSWW